MARTKKVDTTAITSENEVVAETAEINMNPTIEEEVVEQSAPETPVVEEVVKAEKPVEKKLVKDSKVWIVNSLCANRRIRALVEVYLFNAEGKALVNAKDAEAFLKIPGYSIAK